MKLSIIIPVYNTEKYIERCLRSCLQQNLNSNEYEIIVVNDGTKDNSMKIVNDIISEVNNVNVLTQENKGLSAARNFGIKNAVGKYVWCVDSDDWIETNCLKGIVQQMEDDNLEGLVHSGIRYINDENISYMKENYPDKIMKGVDYMNYQTINCAAVKTIYKREFLLNNNLFFYEGIYHEDAEFTPRAYYYIERLGFTHEHFYYNRLTPGSITQKPNPKKAFDLLIVAQRLHDFIKSNNISPYKNAYADLIASDINQSLSNTGYMDESSKKMLGSIIMNNQYLLDYYIKSSKRKYQIEGILFKLFPSYLINIYNLIKRYNV